MTTKNKLPKYRFIIFRAGKLWYWHLVARNGEICAQSEGYHRKAGCERLLNRVTVAIMDGDFSISEKTPDKK